jgi:general stress protein 26
VNDRERMAEYFTPIMKQWFPDGVADPTLRLFVVDPHSAEYWDGPSGLGFFLATARALLTGEKAELGEHEFFEL